MTDPDVQNINQLLGESSASSTSNDPDVQNINFLLGQSSETSTDPWVNFKQKATKIAGEKNYPPNVILGQAALESGHGTSPMARNKNNYFGYMAYDSNPDMARGYQTPEESINDYVDLIKNTPLYSWAYQQWLKDHNTKNLIRNIQLSGYASDPTYADDVMNMPEFKEGAN